MATPNKLPSDDTTGAEFAALVAKAAQPMESARSDKSVSISAGGRAGADIDELDSIASIMASTIKAQKLVMQGTAEADKLLADKTASRLEEAAAQQVSAGVAAGNIAARKTEAELATQNKNIAIRDVAGLNQDDADSALRRSIEDINLSTDRYVELQRAGQHQDEIRQKGFASVLFGDTTLAQHIDAKFINTPESYLSRAGVEAQVVKANSDRINQLATVYTGAAQRNLSTQANLDTGSAADAATLQVAAFSKEASALQVQAATAGSAHLAKVMSQLQHAQTLAVSEATVGVKIEDSKRAEARFSISAVDKDPESFAAAVRLGGQFLGSSALANVKAADLKQYMSTPKNKLLMTKAYIVGAGLAGSASMDPTAPTPNIMGSAGEAQILLEDSRGNLPQGMGRVQKMLQNLAVNTDYVIGPGGIPGKAATSDQRVAMINRNATNWYANNADNIDGTEEYGMSPLKNVVQMASMNTDPDVALFNKTLLVPLSTGVDTVPFDVVARAAVGSALPLNVLVKGTIAYAQSVQAHADATARYSVVGLREASKVPYTAKLTRTGLRNGLKSVTLGDETDVTNYYFRERALNRAPQSLGSTVQDISSRLDPAPQ